MVLQIPYVGISGNEPQEFIYYRLKVHLLGGEQGKSRSEIEPHLIAEHALCPDSGPVMLHHPVLPYMSQKIQILLHVT